MTTETDFDELVAEWVTESATLGREDKQRLLVNAWNAVRVEDHEMQRSTNAKTKNILLEKLRQTTFEADVTQLRDVAERLTTSIDPGVINDDLDVNCALRLHFAGKTQTIDGDVQGIVRELCEQHSGLQKQSTKTRDTNIIRASENCCSSREYQQINLFSGVHTWIQRNGVDRTLEVGTCLSRTIDKGADNQPIRIETKILFSPNSYKAFKITRTLHKDDSADSKEIAQYLHFGSLLNN